MNPKSLREAVSLAKFYRKILIPKSYELALAVPLPYISEVKKILIGSKIKIAIQDSIPKLSKGGD